MNLPFQSYTTQQKNWCAHLLVAAVLCDHSIDREEIEFIKHAISFLENPAEQKKLMQMVQTKRAPELTAPKGFTDKQLAEIFVELVMVVIADDVITAKEQAFLRDAAGLFLLEDAYFAKLLDWAKEGVQWKKGKKILIEQCARKKSAVVQTPPKNKLYSPHPIPENNSLLVQQIVCLVCDSHYGNPRYWRLKTKTQQTLNNLFGIPTYWGSVGGHDEVNYNLHRVIVCPDCYFSSTNPDFFKKDSKHLRPSVLGVSEFRQQWLNSIRERESFLKPFEETLFTHDRAVDPALASYKLAIKTHLTLGQFDRDKHVHEKQVASLFLTMAELQIEKDQKADAIISLKQGVKWLESSFSQLSEFDGLRAARLLVSLYLYFKNDQKARVYLEYIHKQWVQKSKTFSMNETRIIKNLLMETNNLWKNRDLFKNGKVKAFHLIVE